MYDQRAFEMPNPNFMPPQGGAPGGAPRAGKPRKPRAPRRQPQQPQQAGFAPPPLGQPGPQFMGAAHPMMQQASGGFAPPPITPPPGAPGVGYQSGGYGMQPPMRMPGTAFGMPMAPGMPGGGPQAMGYVGDFFNSLFGRPSDYGPGDISGQTDLGRGNVNPEIQRIRNRDRYAS